MRRARGELGADVVFETKHGEADFAVGDRIQFTDTDRRWLSNGAAGVITAIDATGRISARLDARPAGRGEWSPGSRRSSRGSGTATPGRSTRARARRSTTPICCIRATGGAASLRGADPAAPVGDDLRRDRDGARPGPARAPDGRDEIKPPRSPGRPATSCRRSKRRSWTKHAQLNCLARRVVWIKHNILGGRRWKRMV